MDQNALKQSGDIKKLKDYLYERKLTDRTTMSFINEIDEIERDINWQNSRINNKIDELINKLSLAELERNN